MGKALVIADTSPGINLAGMRQIELLPRLYGAVSIPRRVAKEFAEGAQPPTPCWTGFHGSRSLTM